MCTCKVAAKVKNISRLQSALKRQGILVERRHGAYHLSNQHAQASVLLPEALPLEEKAVDQLLAFASVRSPDAHHGVCKACATPDFHPGSVAPVGTIVATDAEFVIPAAIGTDINCGMRLLTTGLKQAAVEARKPELLRGLTRVLLENGRNVPVPGRAFRALFDDGPQAFIERLSSEGLWARADRDQLQAELAQCVSLADFGGAAATRRKAWWAAARRSAIPAWARPAAAITSSSCRSSTRSWTGTPPTRPGWSRARWS